MKDYQNDLRHLRCSLFLAITSVFFFLFIVLLTAEVDASNDEAAGSGRGIKGRGRSIFALLEECSRKTGGGLQ